MRLNFDCNFWRRRDPKLKPRKWVQSENYFAEVNWTTLRVLLLNHLDDISICIKRIDLYQRIVSINDGSKFAQIFEERCKQYDHFLEQLIENKDKIETEIEYYWRIVKEEVGDEGAKEYDAEVHEGCDDQESEKAGKPDLRRLLTHSHQENDRSG